MEDLTIYEVIEAVKGSFGYPAKQIVSSICTDTRKITKGCVFIALKGANFDGHNFAQKAMELGAVAVITQKPIDGVKCIIVDSTQKALLDIAGYYRQRFSPVLVGVTGSVGKTTTKEMIALVIGSKFKTLKTSGNLNNEIGLPLTLLQLDSTYEAAVIEMGMSHFGEISRLSMASKPTCGVITNIGFSHIENLLSQDGILKAKLEILDGMTSEAPLILNGDDKLLQKVGKELNRNLIYYGIENKQVEVFGSDIKVKDGVTYFNINYFGKSISASINCIGIHNVMNALAAFCVGTTLKIEPEQMIKAISEFAPDSMRQSIKKMGNQIVITDCYNASPDSMKASLSVLSEIEPEKSGRRIAVLGDMLELGEMSQNLHKKVGEYVKSSKTDCVICYGEYAKFISEVSGLKESYYFQDKNKTAEFLKNYLKDDDVVLFKASRGMKFEEFISELYNNIG